MDLIDVPQTTKLLLTLLTTFMPILLISVPALTYMNFVNGQLLKIDSKSQASAPKPAQSARVAPCHYGSDGLVPPPPPILQ